MSTIRENCNIQILTDTHQEVKTLGPSQQPTLRAAKYCQIFGKSSKFPEIFAKRVLSDMRNGGGRYLQRICDNSRTDSSLIYHTKALFSSEFIE